MGTHFGRTFNSGVCGSCLIRSFQRISNRSIQSAIVLGLCWPNRSVLGAVFWAILFQFALAGSYEVITHPALRSSNFGPSGIQYFWNRFTSLVYSRMHMLMIMMHSHVPPFGGAEEPYIYHSTKFHCNFGKCVKTVSTQYAYAFQLCSWFLHDTRWLSTVTSLRLLHIRGSGGTQTRQDDLASWSIFLWISLVFRYVTFHLLIQA